MLYDLYKIPIWKTDLKNLNIKQIESYCVELQKKDKQGRKRSNVGGWQSQNLQGLHEPLNPLFNEILNNAESFAQTISIKTPLKFDNVWININGYKDYHIPHIHPQSIFSGVFYVKVPKTKESGGNIDFPHPSYQLMGYDWLPSIKEKDNVYNAASWWLESIENRLYIFPSWLVHGVEPNMSKKEKRIAISFNIILDN